jgi:hypothetical protein
VRQGSSEPALGFRRSLAHVIIWRCCPSKLEQAKLPRARWFCLHLFEPDAVIPQQTMHDDNHNARRQQTTLHDDSGRRCMTTADDAARRQWTTMHDDSGRRCTTTADDDARRQQTTLHDDSEWQW